jgi:myosin heavy subunit
MAETYDVGTRAWQPDATEGWVGSEVVKKTVQGSKVVLQFKLENGEVRIHLHGKFKLMMTRKLTDAPGM